MGGIIGVPAVGAGPRGPRPRPPKTICHGLLSSQLRHGLLSSLHRHGFLSSQLRHGPCLSVPLWRSPSCVPVRVCPEGPPERPPPFPGGTVTAWDMPSGRGELCQGSVVCHLFLPLVSIFGLFPVLVSCRYELICVQLCVCDYVLITLCILVLSFEFDFVWSTRYFPGVSCPCQSCLVLP